MTTADLVKFFAIRRKLGFRDAIARAEAVVIRRSFKPDAPRGPERAQLRLPFTEIKRP